MRTLHSSFNGQTLQTLLLANEAGWDARHIGSLLGYAGDGQRLLKKLRREWAAEFLIGHDWRIVKSQFVLLTPGLDLVLSRTSKAAGKALRLHIVRDVLPIVRAQFGESTPVACPHGVHASTSPFVNRERRLRDKLTLEERRFKATVLRQAALDLRDLGQISDEAYTDCSLAVVSIALGELPEGFDGGRP